jgi:hypothetical protein
MIQATIDEMRKVGFLDVYSEEGDLNLVGRTKNNVSITAERVNDSGFRVIGIKADEEMIYKIGTRKSGPFKCIDDIKRFDDFIDSPNFEGVGIDVKGMLYVLAASPREDDTESLAEITLGKIQREYSGRLRDRLEFNFDAAMQAHARGKPENYIDSIL